MKVHKLLQTAVVSASLLSVAVAPTQAQVNRNIEPGSLLVFPLFDATTGHVTEIRVTDTNDGPFGTGSVRLHYDIVCAGSREPPRAAPGTSRGSSRTMGRSFIRIPRIPLSHRAVPPGKGLSS